MKNTDIIVEPHYLLETGVSGIQTYRGGEAMGERISEWLAHPVGSVSDKPSWGHTLNSLRHEPTSIETEVMYEMAIVEKIMDDIEGLSVKAINIKYVSIDEIYLTITDNHGEISTQLPNL